MTAQTVQLDVADLQQRVQDVYRQVAPEPHRSYHFEMAGRWPHAWATPPNCWT